MGFLIAGVAGYMAGLIGASNSPISGIGILAIVTCATLITFAVTPTPETRPLLVAFALFVTAIVFACATISNDNLQDLKTGQLVGVADAPADRAHRWRRRRRGRHSVCAEPAGQGMSFAGAANVGVVAENPLPAPQATSSPRWHKGDRREPRLEDDRHRRVGRSGPDSDRRYAHRHQKRQLPPLAVGIGILHVGDLRCRPWRRRRPLVQQAGQSVARTGTRERLGTLVASGLIVGESLFGVLNAGLIVAYSNDAPIALVADTFAPAKILGFVGFVGLRIWLYRWMLQKNRESAMSTGSRLSKGHNGLQLLGIPEVALVMRSRRSKASPRPVPSRRNRPSWPASSRQELRDRSGRCANALDP